MIFDDIQEKHIEFCKEFHTMTDPNVILMPYERMHEFIDDLSKAANIDIKTTSAWTMHSGIEVDMTGRRIQYYGMEVIECRTSDIRVCYEIKGE